MPDAEAAKAARAARFGIEARAPRARIRAPPGLTWPPRATQVVDNSELEAKKKARAERFGIVDAGAGNAEVAAKLEARAARFGTAAAAAAPVDPEFEAKKKARAPNKRC